MNYVVRVRSSLVPVVLGLAAMLALAGGLRAGNLYVPNYSFESPVVPQVFPYATSEVDEWQETPQPASYNPSSNIDTPWSYLVGTFYNLPFPESYITNLNGVQAAFVSAYPAVGLIQDYNTIGGTNSAPDHAFNATYEVGKSYTLTVGLTGSTDQPLTQGTTLQLNLYYRDSSNNIDTLATTTVTYDTNVFTDLAALTDFQVQLPEVKPTDPWAGQNIGIEIVSTSSLATEGGYWDVDNVRLTEAVYVPNYSFESPLVPESFPYATNELGEWEETPQPASYNPSSNIDTPWSYLVGTFYNAPFQESYISNLVGIQAAFLSAYPGLGIYQDYNSIGGTNTVPDHSLDATYEVGRAYALTVGLTGSTDEPLTQGTTIQLSLYYRDSTSNIVTVAATTVTYDTNVFTNLTLMTDYSVKVPGVRGSDPWAGQNIGIQLLCTPSLDLAGGYWDVDNVRLVDTTALNVVNATMTNGQLQFTVKSEPGGTFQVLGTTNLSLPVANWTSLGSVSDVTGNVSFTVPSSASSQEFYTARQVGVSKTGQ